MKGPLTQLEKLFRPASIAVYGASDEPGALGTILLQNINAAGYSGEIELINPRHESIDGRSVAPSLRAAGRSPDLALIVAPAATVPDIISDCGAQGVAAAIVVSAGFADAGPQGAVIERDMLERARRYGVRLLGPSCLGMVRTDIGLNASFGIGTALPGRIAVVSQSGALCTAILDWAGVNGVGFSSLISTGAGADVDFAEILDYLSFDPDTDSIMLYLEGVHDARRFMSALRAAARTQPVVVMKGGRYSNNRRAVSSHTGALVGSDAVFDAAIRRAGALRVADIPEFFSVAETLDTRVHTKGRRLGIITNARGPGVMAADRVVDKGLELAVPGAGSIRRLDAMLPHGWSRANPVDVLGDATPDRYAAASDVLVADPGVDGVLVILTPQSTTAPAAVAEQLVALAAATKKPLLACWMGEASVARSREIFHAHDLPCYDTPGAAVTAFAALAAYRDNQQQLLQVPDPLERETAAEPDNARAIIENALAEKRGALSLTESKAVLAAFRIPVLESIPTDTAQKAMVVAQEIGFPVAMKIDSPDISHKTEVGGVRLGVTDARQVRSVFQELTESVAAARPEATIEGVVIEPLWHGPGGRELMVGMVDDEVFGPVISCGLGGTMVEVIGDAAVTLPPLNRFLARELIDRTRATEALGPLRGAPAADRSALEDLLVKVSEMVCELPAIVEMDLNPVVVHPGGAVVVDARMSITRPPAAARAYAHMAIHPYPRKLVQGIELADGTPVTIRPIRPEDAAIETAFVEGLSDKTRYYRFMHAMKKLSPQLLSRFTQIDYDREMALLAVTNVDGEERAIGVARYATLPDPEACEYAIAIADEWQGKGLARPLVRALTEAARDSRYQRMVGTVLRENRRMLAFSKSLGFKVSANAEDRDIMDIELAL